MSTVLDESHRFQRFIVGITYAPDETTLILYYRTSSHPAQPAALASGRVGAADGQPSVVPHAKSPTDRGASCRMAPDRAHAQTITLIIPHPIHGCRQKDLR